MAKFNKTQSDVEIAPEERKVEFLINETTRGGVLLYARDVGKRVWHTLLLLDTDGNALLSAKAKNVKSFETAKDGRLIFTDI